MQGTQKTARQGNFASKWALLSVFNWENGNLGNKRKFVQHRRNKWDPQKSSIHRIIIQSSWIYPPKKIIHDLIPKESYP